MQCAIDHFGRSAKVRQQIGAHDVFARRLAAACDAAGSMLAEFQEDHGVTENRVIGCLETCGGIGDHTGFNSSGLHLFHPPGVVGWIADPCAIIGAAAISSNADRCLRLFRYSAISACFISSCSATALPGSKYATPPFKDKLYRLSARAHSASFDCKRLQTAPALRPRVSMIKATNSSPLKRAVTSD